jgi:membrane fusion protein, copper/silver efflux system
MRPAKVLIAVLLAAGLFAAGYMVNGQHTTPGKAAAGSQAAAYTCPMHPQYTSDHPGDCPICGMRLEPVAGGQARDAEAAATHGSGTVVVGAAMQQRIGLQVQEVHREPSTHLLRVPGRIAVDDQRLYRVIAATDGWVVELRPDTVGRFVKKDQLLATYYTKDLLYTERLFLLSVPADQLVQTESRDFSQASIRTSGSANPLFPVDALRGLGMSDLQIREIHRTRTASPYVAIYAPASGFVLARSISPGQRFDKGTEFYRIADIGHVWLLTDVFEKDREFLKPGTKARFEYQGRRFSARLSDALPQFDTQSRTLKTRFELDNPGNILQPDMFVDVEIDVEMPAAMTVPADAVFDSGVRKTVFVERGQGEFEPRRVETGWRLGGRVEIVRGLMEGDRVVAAANFLLDSESRMKAASAGISDPEKDPVCGMDVDGKKASDAGRTATHDGHNYYFCSDDCKQKFQKDPGAYVQ